MKISLKGLRILTSFPERYEFHNITGILADKFIDDKLGNVEKVDAVSLKLRTKLISVFFEADSIACEIKEKADNSEAFQQLNSLFKVFFDKLGISTVRRLAINYLLHIDVTPQFKNTLHFMQKVFIKSGTIDSEQLSDIVLIYEYSKHNFSVQSRLETIFDENKSKELKSMITLYSSINKIAVADILPKLQLGETIYSYEISKFKKWVANKKEKK